MQSLSLLEQQYGAQVRRNQMMIGLAGEIKHLVLQVLNEANCALTIGEIIEKVERLLPSGITDQMGCDPYHLSAFDLVEIALNILHHQDFVVGKKEVYHLLHTRGA